MEGIVGIISIAVAAFVMLIWYKLITKMGYPGWYIAMFLIPFVGLFFMIYLAFAEWPIERELSNQRFNTKMQPDAQPTLRDPSVSP